MNLKNTIYLQPLYIHYLLKMLLWVFIISFTNAIVTVEGEELKTVLEGAVLNLQTGEMELKGVSEVTWLYRKGDKTVRIAQMYKGFQPFYEGKLTGRLEMDPKTGSLTLWNISNSDSGLYEVSISKKRFRVDVYGAVSLPVIRSLASVNQTQGTVKQPQAMNQICTVVCSVKNERDVFISWYKDGEIVNQSSNPELNISLSLPLELHYEDPESYSCTAANPVSNKSVRLHVKEICSRQEDCQDHCGATESRIRLVLSALVGIATVVFVVDHLRC